MGIATGLDILVEGRFAGLSGRNLGLLCNQAAVDHDYRHILDLLVPLHTEGEIAIRAIFGPQHGLFGHTQDNMIEWEGGLDPRTGIAIHSLYGRHREPTAEMLQGIDLFVVDIQDVGARYYTFVWTMANCLRACAAQGIPALVLDRPNPIGAAQIEGPVLRPGFESFVGLYPLPIRHGMTVGEIAAYLRRRYFPSLDLAVVETLGWRRSDYLDETDAPWAMPSPNMPSVATAVVYPGGCLLEGTNLSEGRGTTRPFEILGAPFLDAWRFASALNGRGLPGAAFRPIQFQPTFNKHEGRICDGVFVHVTDRRTFAPVATYVAIIQEAIGQSGLHETDARCAIGERFSTSSAECDLPGFAWKLPPYEYETERLPIDILAGNGWLRPAIERQDRLDDISKRFCSEVRTFGQGIESESV